MGKRNGGVNGIVDRRPRGSILPPDDSLTLVEELFDVVQRISVHAVSIVS